MMDCDTTGIEPDIAFVKYKQLAGGGMLEFVNQTVPLALRTLGNNDAGRGHRGAHRQERHDRGRRGVEAQALVVFDLAFPPHNGNRSIPWRSAHSDDGRGPALYFRGDFQNREYAQGQHPGRHSQRIYRGLALGLRPPPIYRDGSKEVQPLSTRSKSDKGVEKPVLADPCASDCPTLA